MYKSMHARSASAASIICWWKGFFLTNYKKPKIDPELYTTWFKWPTPQTSYVSQVKKSIGSASSDTFQVTSPLSSNRNSVLQKLGKKINQPLLRTFIILLLFFNFL